MKCKDCGKNIDNDLVYFCPNCGRETCEKCGLDTLKICPNCYHDLDIK